MTEEKMLDRRVVSFRLVLWLATLLISFVHLRPVWPQAWQVAAFGAVFALLSTIIRRDAGRRQRATDPASEGALQAEKPEERQVPAEGGISPPHASFLSEAGPQPYALDVGMDALILTALAHVTGGFQSPFTPLNIFLLAEATVLLGGQGVLLTALAVALLNLVHFRFGLTRQATLLYGLESGALILSALLVGRQDGAGSGASGPIGSRLFRRTKTRTVEILERELEDLNVSHRQLKESYREVAQLHRDQKTQIERLRAGERLLKTSITSAFTVDAVRPVYAWMLHIVADLLEAGGGVLWLRASHTDALTVQVTEGRIAPSVQAEPILHASTSSPSELRAVCAARLGADAPAQTEEGKGAAISSSVTRSQPVAVALLYAKNVEGTSDGLVGAVGLCAPRSAARFAQADIDHLTALADPLAAALANLDQRHRLQRRSHELAALYDLSRMVQSATEPRQIYQVVVAQAQQLIPCANCTLFLLDAASNRLQPEATRGQVVPVAPLFDTVAFARGHGLSEWIASPDQQIIIEDLSQEFDLRDRETISPEVRSLAAVPLRTQKTLIGLLAISDPQPSAFSPNDVRLLSLLASQTAATIERTEQFHTLETMAITDGLTQVYNHRYFQMRLEDEMKRVRRYETPLTLMLVDADHFKAINDLYGHLSGDAVLRDLAAMLHRAVRETEVVARYGGEEFALILPQTGLEQAQIAAERVRAAVEAQAFMTLDGQPVSMTISIGLAAFPQHGMTGDALIASADHALYAAKQSGRNAIRS